MQVTVFGANGKVGRLVVAGLLDAGDSVVAFVHGTSDLIGTDKLKVIKGDIYNPDDVARALDGSNAVVSTLGSWGTPHKDILTKGMQSIIPAMKEKGISRIISLTGSDARAPGDKPPLFNRLSHLLLSVVAGKILKDGERHIQLLVESELDWTVIRSPVMKENDSSEFHLGAEPLLPWATIHRHAVAKALVEQISKTEFSRIAPIISRK